MFLGGDTTGSGIHFGGVDSKLPETGKDGADGSGFIRSIGYQGFVSASAQSGSYGFMIYSGSVFILCRKNNYTIHKWFGWKCRNKF